MNESNIDSLTLFEVVFTLYADVKERRRPSRRLKVIFVRAAGQAWA